MPSLLLALEFLDDVHELSAKVKLIGQIAAALLIVKSGLTIDHLTIPLLDKYELGVWAYPVTVIWIVAITNAINLIDGLDGLSGGISSIALATIATMGFF
ncbi:hypothetical protein GCM10020331_026660 [Ectobacillus funiculus]